MAIELTTQDYLDLALADLEQTRTENERLTDCLEETIDELLCGNRLQAELAAAYREIQYHIARYQASEAARLSAVRELEKLKQKRVKMDAVISKYWHDKTALQSRLSRAEEALHGLHRWLTDPGVKVLCEGLPEQMGYSGACQKVVAALQPEGEQK